MIDLQFVKLYFSPNFNYVQFNNINLDTKVPAIASAAHVRLPQIGSAMRSVQERIQIAVKRSKKSHVRS